ncbi:hypothetical protein GOBAR_AA02644 [Gossypium barbadense]|uniref:beta-galactosidase n=1 Tax=Gossypium barbadense TaxID=3634 RepID=A0A2P5YQT0_GOSBA|nr:hypothetical protein GOBAR_AA02644 [Gossypium barbadense]
MDVVKWKMCSPSLLSAPKFLLIEGEIKSGTNCLLSKKIQQAIRRRVNVNKLGLTVDFSLKLLEMETSSVFKPLVLFFAALLVNSKLIQCNITYDNKAILISGQRRIPISDFIHYHRSTPGMWENLINKAKDEGLDAVDTYVFWNGHELFPGNLIPWFLEPKAPHHPLSVLARIWLSKREDMEAW